MLSLTSLVIVFSGVLIIVSNLMTSVTYYTFRKILLTDPWSLALLIASTIFNVITIVALLFQLSAEIEFIKMIILFITADLSLFTSMYLWMCFKQQAKRKKT